MNSIVFSHNQRLLRKAFFPSTPSLGLNIIQYYSSSSNDSDDRNKISIPIKYKDTEENDINIPLLKEIVVGLVQECKKDVELSASNIKFTQVSGGITNKLFKCTKTCHLKHATQVKPLTKQIPWSDK